MLNLHPSDKLRVVIPANRKKGVTKDIIPCMNFTGQHGLVHARNVAKCYSNYDAYVELYYPASDFWVSLDDKEGVTYHVNSPTPQ